MRQGSLPFALRRSPRTERGFTLTELMAVVLITGVLAVLGTTMFRQHILASRTVETTSMIRSIAAAQERFRGETMSYLNVSTGNWTAYYPSSDVGAKKYHWVNPTHAHFDNWRLLAPTVPGPVQFGYVSISGGPGVASMPGELQVDPGWPTTPTEQPWYVIQAMGDLNENGVPTYFVGSSFSSQIFSGGDAE